MAPRTPLRIVRRASGALAGLLAALLLGTAPAHALTFVLDFIEPGEPTETFLGNPVEPLFPGVGDADFGIVLDRVRGFFEGIPTADADPRSPIPAGMQLDVDFVEGEIGLPPANGDPAWITAAIGTSSVQGTGGLGLVGIVPSAPGRLGSATWVEPALFGLTAEIVAHEIGHNAGLRHVDLGDVTTPAGERPLLLPVLRAGERHAFSFESAGVLAATFGLRPVAVAVAEPAAAAIVLAGLAAVSLARPRPRATRRAACPSSAGRRG